MRVVTERSHRNKHKQWVSLYECSCGRLFEACDYHVKAGHTRSCGCLQKTKAAANGRAAIPRLRLPPGEASCNEVIKQYVQDARRRDLAWGLPRDRAKHLLSNDCHYCGSPPMKENWTKSGDLFIYNGIDRVDNRGGYTTENTVSCCNFCNLAKRNRSKEEFVAWLNRVALKTGKAFCV